jgi:hypothetical protein
MENGRTPQERSKIFEQLILAACEERERRKSSEHGGSITEENPPIDGLLYDYNEVERGISISAFEEADTN